MANATMTTFTVEDENGNQVTYDVADAKARADIDEILLNGTGGIKEETDPTVPAWAKQPNKPTYTAAEVNALPANTKIPTVPTNVSAFTNDVGYLVDTDLPYMTPQMFGAKADGVTDDTAAINAAINAIPDGGTLFFPNGTYLVKENDSSTNNDRIAIRIDNRQNITLLLSDHAVLQHATTTSNYYRTIRINNSTNVTIRGGCLIGDFDTHTPVYNEAGTSMIDVHGYGIRVIDSEGITIDGVDLSKYYGDPIVLCSELTPYQGCKDVTIKNCIIHDSVRNGITVTACQGLFVKDCEIYNISGGLPMAGVDIEGEYPGAVNENITFEGCYIHDNGELSIAVVLTASNVQVKNCKLLSRFTATENTTGVTIADSIVSSAVLESDVVITNSTIGALGLGAGNVSAIGCRFAANADSAHNVIIQSTSTNARFIGCEFVAADTQNVGFYTVRANKQAQKIVFNDCVFRMKAINYTPFGNMGVSEFVGCTFIGELATQSKAWLSISGSKADFSDCVFDASALTTYTENSALVSINTTNATIKSCTVKAASKICANAFSCTGTGEIYLIDNVLPLWDSVGAMPTSATKLVLIGNILSTSESEVVYTAEDKEKLDNIDAFISESGFPTEDEMKAYVDNEIAELKAEGAQQSPLFANTVDDCTDATRLYVLPDGYIYAYMAVEKEVEAGPAYTNLLPLATDTDRKTIYNGIGYKSGERLTSSGATAAHGSAICTTGFIPASPGDVLRIEGIVIVSGTTKYIWAYDANNATTGYDIINDGGFVGTVTDTTLEVTLSSSLWGANFNAIRISNGFDENTIITVNEEIVEGGGTTTVIEYEWVNTGLAFVPANYEDRILALEAKIAELEA